MQEVKVADIKVGPRFRKKFEAMEELAASISAVGLIEPIVLDEHQNLIAGERRLRAHQLLKKEFILARTLSDLSEIEKKEIELEENIQRKEFTWQEEVDAKNALHKLKQELHGAAIKGHDTKETWKLKDTANALGESVGTTSMDIQLARGMKAFPELMKEKSKTTAFKKLKKLQMTILENEMAERLQTKGLLKTPEVIHGCCIEEMKKMKSESVDLILSDPPYGIDIGKAQTYERSTVTDTRFEDSDFATFDLLDKAFEQMYRILKPDRHMYIFCAIDKVPEVNKLLTKYGFEVHKLPIIWDKGSGSYPSQSTTYVHSYEPFLHVMKGKRKLNGTPRDVFPIKRVPSNKKVHPTEKPTELLRDLIKMSTLAGETVFDPFSGSGSTIAAAKETSRQALGVEKDPVFYQKICERMGGN